MKHAHEIIKDIVSRLGEPPLTFQRDGMTYILNNNSVGCLRYGLSTRCPDGYQDEETAHALHEATTTVKDDPRIKLLRHGPDTRAWTLREMQDMYAKLRESDRNTIPILRHGENYRSHKYGYAADGIDVFLTGSHAMDAQTFDFLMGKRDSDIRADLPRKTTGAQDRRLPSYEHIALPHAFVLTAELLFAFPRPGHLECRSEQRRAWTTQTEIETGRNEYHVVVESPTTYRESPFGCQIVINAHDTYTRTGRELMEAIDKHEFGLERALTAIRLSLDDAYDYCNSLNDAHNKIYKDDIEWSAKNRIEPLDS